VTVGREHDKVKPNGKNWANLRVPPQDGESSPTNWHMAVNPVLPAFIGLWDDDPTGLSNMVVLLVGSV
jgi:hypothetical protein